MLKLRKEETKDISLDDLVFRLQNGDKLTVVYRAKSELPYYAFFSKTSHGNYGFRSHCGLGNKMTYMEGDIRASLQAASKAGKDVLVFEREEVDKLYKI